jgi:hypothetical protein
MEVAEILAGLGSRRRSPVAFIEAARAQRGTITPIFLETIDRYLASRLEPLEREALFLIFHLLGEWQEKAAYRPLARLLRRPTEELEDILGDAMTETSHRVMAAVFDGDPQPLYDIIGAPEADEYIRARMLEAVALLVLKDELPREEAARFLRACHAELEPRGECWVWEGWQSAIALLGLAELKPLVEQAFADGFISPQWLAYRHFEKDLTYALEHPAAPHEHFESQFAPFRDTVQEFAEWPSFQPEKRRVRSRRAQFSVLQARAINFHKNVGRNDPCPCGSGKKYKKCCLAVQGSPRLSTEPRP